MRRTTTWRTKTAPIKIIISRNTFRNMAADPKVLLLFLSLLGCRRGWILVLSRNLGIEHREHALRRLGIRTIRLQFQILLKSLFCSRLRGNGALGVGLGFGYQINSILVIGVGVLGIGLDGLLKGISGRFDLLIVHQQRTEIV